MSADRFAPLPDGPLEPDADEDDGFDETMRDEWYSEETHPEDPYTARGLKRSDFS